MNNQKTFVYIESTQSPAFQFIPFKTYKQAERFIKILKTKSSTLRARIWERFKNRAKKN